MLLLFESFHCSREMKFQREQIPSRPVLIRLAIATEPLKRSFKRRYKRNLDSHSFGEDLCKVFERKNTENNERPFSSSTTQ